MDAALERQTDRAKQSQQRDGSERGHISAARPAHRVFPRADARLRRLRAWPDGFLPRACMYRPPSLGELAPGCQLKATCIPTKVWQTPQQAFGSWVRQ